MVMYAFVLAVYVDEKNIEDLKKLCDEHEFEFEESVGSVYDEPDWQEHYRRESGFSGKIIRVYITNRTNYRSGYDELFTAIEQANFDIFVNVEIS